MRPVKEKHRVVDEWFRLKFTVDPRKGQGMNHVSICPGL